MIDELHIQNLALIESANIHFSDSFTVLTGETGAGKSAVLNALKLLIGDRADQSWLKDGSDKLLIEGRYFLDDIDSEDGLVVRRTMGVDGKSRVQIDGSMSSVKALAQELGSRVDMLGQHEHQSLLRPQTHPDIFDRWIGPEAFSAKLAYEQAYVRRQDALFTYNKTLEDVNAATDTLEDALRLKSQVDSLNPNPGEYEELSEVLDKLEHADSLFQKASELYELLEGDDGILERISYAKDLASEISSIDSDIDSDLARMDSLGIELSDVAHEIRAYRDAIDLDDEKLERLRMRQHNLQSLMRSYGPNLTDVLDKYAEAKHQLDLRESSELYIKEAKKELDQAQEALEAKAREWFDVRRKHAKEFSEHVSEYLHRLEMEQARFDVDIRLLDAENFTAHNAHHLEFTLAPSIDSSQKPLAQIASGGEASRVMLAIKTVMGESDQVETLIFDEVDAGIGGQTALSVAEILLELAQSHQIIVVSHLPQIAVCADSHYLVYKDKNEKGSLVTCVKELDANQRIEEIARMLAGDCSQSSLTYAKELLEKAGKL